MEDWGARALEAVRRLPGTGVVLLDDTLTVRWVASTVERVLAHPDGLVGLNAIELVHPDDLDLVGDATAAHLREPDHFVAVTEQRGGRPLGAQVRFRRGDGSWTELYATLTNELETPGVGAFVVTVQMPMDQSDLSDALDLLGSDASTAEVMQSVVRYLRSDAEDCAVALRWFDDNGGGLVHEACDRFDVEALTDRALYRDALEGNAEIANISLDDLAARTRSALEPLAEGYRTVRVIPVREQSSALLGVVFVWTSLTYEFSLRSMLHASASVRLAALTILDHRRRAQLRRVSSTDPLTGLGNRIALDECFRSLGDAPRWPVAALCIDLDDFKPVNDHHGHGVGDVVLAEVARRILETVRSGDVVTRLGGDEFIVVCPSVGDDQAVAGLAARLVDVLARPVRVGDVTTSVTASLGWALAADDDELATLVRRADHALYAAKRGGKNQCAGGALAA